MYGTQGITPLRCFSFPKCQTMFMLLNTHLLKRAGQGKGSHDLTGCLIHMQKMWWPEMMLKYPGYKCSRLGRLEPKLRTGVGGSKVLPIHALEQSQVSLSCKSGCFALFLYHQMSN